jgi:hypothetical protein
MREWESIDLIMPEIDFGNDPRVERLPDIHSKDFPSPVQFFRVVIDPESHYVFALSCVTPDGKTFISKWQAPANDPMYEAGFDAALERIYRALKISGKVPR